MKKLDATTVNLNKETRVKRKTVESSSSSISFQSEVQMLTTEATKKFKTIRTDNNVICDDDIEGDIENDVPDCLY